MNYFTIYFQQKLHAVMQYLHDSHIQYTLLSITYTRVSGVSLKSQTVILRGHGLNPSLVSFSRTVGKRSVEGVRKCTFFSLFDCAGSFKTGTGFRSTESILPVNRSKLCETLKKNALEINHCFACQTNMSSRVLPVLLLQASISGWWRLRRDCGILNGNWTT